jgi:hypothetical protein
MGLSRLYVKALALTRYKFDSIGLSSDTLSAQVFSTFLVSRKVMLVANCQTERDSELLTSEVKLDF